MTGYILKRVGMALLTIFIVITLTFFIMHAVPGGPFASEKATNPAAVEALEEKYGLDKPLIEQYFTYLGDLLQGDFGPSLKLRGREVADIISDGFTTSALVGALAAMMAIVIGIVLGSIAALKHNQWADRFIMVLSTMSVAVPSFIMGTLLLYVFAVSLGWFPVRGDDFEGQLLPMLTLALYPMAYIIRLTRSSMLDVLGQDYIRTAQAKGVGKTSILFKHALRNAVTPVITYAGPMIAFILTGSMVVEKIFQVPGLGSSFVSSINTRDYTLIMGVTIFLAILLVVLNLVSDILYKVFDPRVTFE